MRPKLSVVAGLTSALMCSALFVASPAAGYAQTPQDKAVITRGESTIVLEPYAPNVMRVTLSLLKDQAIAGPGYGVVASPAPNGWSYSEGEDADTYRSSRMVVSLLGGRGHGQAASTKPTELTNVQKTQTSIGKIFNGSTPWADIRFSTPDGKLLLEM